MYSRRMPYYGIHCVKHYCNNSAGSRLIKRRSQGVAKTFISGSPAC